MRKHSSARPQRARGQARRQQRRSISTSARHSSQKVSKSRQIQSRKITTRATSIETTYNKLKTPKNVRLFSAEPEYQSPFGNTLQSKVTTGITGLAVVPNARDVLESLYTHIIKLSEEYNTGKHRLFNDFTANQARWRLDVLKKFPNDDHTAERVIASGQFEELIEEAERDLYTLTQFNEFKIHSTDPVEFPMPIGSQNTLHEIQMFPLPKEVTDDLVTELYTIVPHHPTKKISPALLKHMGVPEQITPEMEAEHKETMANLTDEQKAKIAKNKELGINFISDDVRTTLYKNKPNGLTDEQWNKFTTNTSVFPELDEKNNNLEKSYTLFSNTEVKFANDTLPALWSS